MSNLEATLKRLRVANLQRLPLFKNRRGEPAHSRPDGSDWSMAEWTNAVAGEVGEACNIAKKLRRGDFGPPYTPGYIAGCSELAHELADVVIYADLTCFRCGHSTDTLISNIDLGVNNANGLAECTNRIAEWAGQACGDADWITSAKFASPGEREDMLRSVAVRLAAAVRAAEAACVVADRDICEAIVEKFNIVSDRVGCEVKL